MAIPSPLRTRWIELGATLVLYGPPERGVELTESFGDLELEYASIRRGCALIDRPDRAVVEATGADRAAFLNSMLTQNLKDAAPGEVRRSFWLNRKGRLVADVRALVLPDRILFDLDAHSAEPFRASLDGYIIADQVALTDATDRWHRLSLHGPTSGALLAALADAPPTLPEPGRSAEVTLAGATCLLDRWDWAGEPGYELWCPAADAPAVADRLLQARLLPPTDAGPPEQSDLARAHRLRPCGWFALNIARVEAGTPLMHLDFTTESLPAETGVLRDRVDFKKGCYLGQEVVARMDALGHPKQVLVGLRFRGEAMRDEDGQPRQPVGGDPVLASPAADAPQVGAITSSAVSPMLGAEPIALAVVRWGHHEPGTALAVVAEGVPVEAIVQPGLAFYTRPARD